VNGEPAYLSYVSPIQINLLTPADLPSSGQITLQISNNGLTSSTLNIATQAVAPSFYLFNSDKYIAAVHANYSLIGPTTLFPNSSTPAAPGETIVLYGNGFGTTSPPVPGGQMVSTAATLVTTPTILFNNVAAKVVYAGLVGAGLYQFNVIVPAGLPDGDAAVVAQTLGSSSPAGALITIKN
jgi:uncharacterized protein (TIGR03437 family)